MISIIILGAGRSTSSLIEYLATHSDHVKWTLTVVDIDKNTIDRKCNRYKNVKGVAEDLKNSQILDKWIQSGDIIVSMLPAFMHPVVAKRCIHYSKHMVTASYAGEEMKSLDAKVKEKDLIFMNECGVDPGIDHMSTMEIIERLRDDKSEILSYESFTGGILAPESAKTLWNYKFTWNPRNVVLAGAGSAVKFIQEGLYKFIPYNKVFRRTEFIKIPGYGRFEGYANRDSLKYISEYGLEGIPTMFRGTLRRPGFCRAWMCLLSQKTINETSMSHI
ncbi:MAG: saccharopine dehydrogenase C-terminal domain-containing protein [Schleiferiaceae bacterium]|nr:saccharopine dehydrogenase C-terminal domain-containing protein [Schleiferiaceae bacterium]